MKNSKFNITMSFSLKNKPKKIKENSKGQMIILMGVILALSVLLIASIPSEIVGIDVIASRERSTSLLPEFIHIKKAFGRSLNFNLLETQQSSQSATLDFEFPGNINNIENALNQTRDSFSEFELKHDIFFNATLKSYSFSHSSSFYGADIFSVIVNLLLDNGETSISEDVEYYIICNLT